MQYFIQLTKEQVIKMNNIKDSSDIHNSKLITPTLEEIKKQELIETLAKMISEYAKGKNE